MIEPLTSRPSLTLHFAKIDREQRLALLPNLDRETCIVKEKAAGRAAPEGRFINLMLTMDQATTRGGALILSSSIRFPDLSC